MSENLERMLEIETYDERYALKYTTEMLEADVEHGAAGIATHPRTARELLRLDTAERRQRVMQEAMTLSNLLGGIVSIHTGNAATTLLRMIAEGREDDELYGERTAREYREREAALRAATGNPAAIYYPKTWGMA